MSPTFCNQHANLSLTFQWNSVTYEMSRDMPGLSSMLTTVLMMTFVTKIDLKNVCLEFTNLIFSGIKFEGNRGLPYRCNVCNEITVILKYFRIGACHWPIDDSTTDHLNPKLNLKIIWEEDECRVMKTFEELWRHLKSYEYIWRPAKIS